MYLGLFTYQNLRDGIVNRKSIRLGALIICICMNMAAMAADGKKTLVISSIAPMRHGARLTDIDTVSRGDTVSFRVSVRYTNYAKATKAYKLNKKDSVYVTVSLATKDMIPDEQTSSVTIKKQKGSDVVGHALFTYPLKNPYFFISDGLKVVITVNDEVLFSKTYRYVFNKGDTTLPAPVRPKGNSQPAKEKAPERAMAQADTRTAQNTPDNNTPKPVKEDKPAKPAEKPKEAVKETPKPKEKPAEKPTEKPEEKKEPVKEPVKEAPKPKDTKPVEKPAEKQAEKPVEKEPATTSETPAEKPKPAAAPKEKKNFFFTVQLVAGKLPQSKLDELAKIFGPVGQEEVKPGVIRYMVGQYTRMSKANEGLSKAKNGGFKDAFLTGYEGDNRLTPARLMDLGGKNP